jgi:hypothetical protein
MTVAAALMSLQPINSESLFESQVPLGRSKTCFLGASSISPELKGTSKPVNLRKTPGDDALLSFFEDFFLFLGFLGVLSSLLRSREFFEKVESSKLISLRTFLGEICGLIPELLLFLLKADGLKWGLLAGLSPF